MFKISQIHALQLNCRFTILHQVLKQRKQSISTMPESLLEKYPHLKLLRSSVSGDPPASPPSAVDPDAAPSLRRPMSAMTGSKEESPVAAVLRNRKSILGPGVGARLDRKPIVKPQEPAR